jgi:hypothetical protein
VRFPWVSTLLSSSSHRFLVSLESPDKHSVLVAVAPISQWYSTFFFVRVPSRLISLQR